MSRKLTEKLEALAALDGHLPQDVYEWMAATATPREKTFTASAKHNQPLDMSALATSCMLNAAMKSKRKPSQQRI